MNALRGAVFAFVAVVAWLALCTFVAWGESPATWDPPTRALVGVVTAGLSILAFIAGAEQ